MSDDKKIHKLWTDPKFKSEQPAGPPKPWDEKTEAEAKTFVEDFLVKSEAKEELTKYIIDLYKQLEREKIEEFKAKMKNEIEANNNRAEKYHEPGNIAPLLSKTFNMSTTEHAFAKGLKTTHECLMRSVDDRVEEINNLLSGIGGFSSQLKGCFARSTVIFLEQDDPKAQYRERLVFSIHLPQYELKSNWSKKVPSEKKEDGRTSVQATWDDAVNALAQIIEKSGLKPKYCKNDRNFGRFVMKQDLRNNLVLPDEYFSITLDYNTDEKLVEMRAVFNKVLSRYEEKISKLKQKLDKYPTSCEEPFYLKLRKKFFNAVEERDVFTATIPDPSQLDEGLLLVIEVNTLKDYHIVKDRMQSIMTKFILHLSSIATEEAKKDPNLEYEFWKTGKGKDGEESFALDEKDLSSLKEYVVKDSSLIPVGKKIDKKAA